MKWFSILVIVFLGSVALALNPFFLQTGGNGILATGYQSVYGSPSDLYGIMNSAFSTNFTEVTRSASPLVNERSLYVQLFEDSDDGMAGVLQYYMDIGQNSGTRSLSYGISGALGSLTMYGADLKVGLYTAAATPVYDVGLKGGISGKAFQLLDYVAAFESTLWTSGSNSNTIDVLAGIRFVPDPFMLGLELGTRYSMKVRYFGLSAQYTYNRMFTARGGVSMNLDFLNNIDYLVGAGIELKIGNMLVSAGVGANLTKKIELLNIERTWNVSVLGQW